ncbi:hypothetical protein NDU88_010798 [Pleurodeles waltl]|uniref:Uncharacterized protein n=1 Tax=Pleurodeles waltl TaxID=8319 RepID=A0AAV7S3L7_PLEWA|nr:hypothetical protein NDU88_010798 [Pleurodeles waltl]
MNFQGSDVILQTARKKDPWKIEGQDINIYPDYTAIVQLQSGAFVAVKKVLWQLNLKYALIYTAKQRVERGGKAHFLATPQVAQDWLDVEGLCSDPAQVKDCKEAWKKQARRCRNRRGDRARSATTQEQIIKAQIKTLQDIQQKIPKQQLASACPRIQQHRYGILGVRPRLG